MSPTSPFPPFADAPDPGADRPGSRREKRRKKRHRPTQVMRILQAIEESGQTISEACRDHHITAQTYYRWRQKYLSPDQDDGGDDADDMGPDAALEDADEPGHPLEIPMGAAFEAAANRLETLRPAPSFVGSGAEQAAGGAGPERFAAYPAPPAFAPLAPMAAAPLPTMAPPVSDVVISSPTAATPPPPGSTFTNPPMNAPQPLPSLPQAPPAQPPHPASPAHAAGNTVQPERYEIDRREWERLRRVEEENARLKRLVIRLSLEKQEFQEEREGF